MIEVCIQMPKTRLSDRDKKLIHLTVANTIKSITEATFSSTGLQYRVRPWPPKRDGSPCWLVKTSLCFVEKLLDHGPERAQTHALVTPHAHAPAAAAHSATNPPLAQGLC